MPNIEYTFHYNSPLGGITLASDGVALTGLWFDGQKHFADCLAEQHQEKLLDVFELTAKWLDIYFSGKAPEFTPPLKMKTTEFRKTVWKIMQTIPYGQSITYGQIAASIAVERGIERISAQAVGNAVAHNSISLIIPCHRVIGSDDSLIGYAGGIDRKFKLLELEKASISFKANLR